MGLMECLPGHSRLVTTPHPVTCEGQTNIAAELIPGETLGTFLRRSVPDWAGDAWEVRINGVVVPHEVMERVRPKDGTLIEVRGVVRKQALYIVAMIALTYFTMGAGATWAGALGATGMAATAVYAAAFIAGSILINKVLSPKPPSPRAQEQQTVYNIGAGRNQARPYQPLPLVFGTVKYAPDVISAPYTWYEGDDQYLGMVLTPGINAHSFEPLLNGDAQLSSFQGVQVYQSGFPGMPDQTIPLYSDSDTIQGGELNKNRVWVERTTPARTVRIQINLEYILGDQTSKGKPYINLETVEAQYRVTGATNWMPLVSRNFSNSSYDPKRATMSRDVEEGQYDVRVRILGRAVDGGGSNGRSQWNWNTMTAVQADTATYAGIPRIGVRIKATGQLQGAPDELRCVVHSRPIPVWTGTSWVTQETSNPGAQILAYARGINDENGHRIGGIGLTDDMIDIAALQAFMLHCAANQFEYNYVVKDARSHDEMVNSLAAAGFGQVTWAGGRLSVVWAAADQPLSGVVNMATIKKGEFQVDYTLANAADGIEYSYYDAEDWSTKTIRVPAPGVTTMLNPAQVTGEGVTSEAHAAMLARWHLAQSLYQYKDISFATDIEHLSYQRLSLLSLSHDLTQWGYSGRLVGVSIVGGVVSLALDEPVPAPPPGGAYIGLRIPGERTYRVFAVQPFEGESRTLTLVGAWPGDAPVPGNSDGNPAHDTIWCYDFKATPGYRVRVVAIEPESDLKGARVAVVPEGPEFWNYVLTGEYIPAPNQSLLQTRPIASNLLVSERQVVQGDTVFTELVATFDVDGPVGDVIVQMSNENDELVEVARTTSRTAAWRIPGAGTYQVVVRPFSPEGQPGIAAATIYSTTGTDAPPVLVDLFDVQERSGGVRLYTWGWLSGTTQSADFAGVEIRYIAGNVPSPEWNDMTPVGTDGYYTAPFEAVIPESGEWTFAARSRNTSGTLSTGMRVLTKTLGANLGEQIGGIGDAIDYITQQQVAQQEALDAEVFARVQADIAVAEAAGADATAKANNARDTALAAAADAHTAADNARIEALAAAAAASALAAAAQASADALASEVGEIVNAPEWSAAETYSAGWLVKEAGVLYRAKAATTNQRPSTTPAVWERIGEYASLGEAVAAALSTAEQTATELEAESARLNAVVARMPAGTGQLATTAMVTAEETARVAGDQAQATLTTALTARVERTAQSGANLLPDGGFETLPLLPGSNRASIVSTVKRSGANSVRIVGGSSGFAIAPLLNGVTNVAGRTFYVEYWIRATAPIAAGFAVLQFRMRAPGATQPSVYHEVSVALNTVPTDGWLKVSAVRPAWPGAGNNTDIWLISAPSFASGEIFIDDVLIVDITESHAAQTTANQAAADIVTEQQVRASADAALAQRTSAIETRMPAEDGQLATSAAVAAVETAATTAAGAVAGRVGVVEARMPAGNGQLSTAAATAAAQSAAESAATAAGNKGKVLFQSATPATADRLPQNLWIDTTGNANTPKRWNGTDWVAVTDKAATDAAAAAASALSHSQNVDARVTAVESASVGRDNALGSRVGVVEARMPTGTDTLANEARVVTAENASVSRDNALGTRVGVVEARMPSGTDKLANEARVVAAETAATTANTAVANRTTAVEAKVQNIGGDNLIPNSSFETRTSDAVAPTGFVIGGSGPTGATFSYVDSDLSGSIKAVRRAGTSTVINQYLELRTLDNVIKATPGQSYVASAFMRGTLGAPSIIVWFLSAAGTTIGSPHTSTFTMSADWQRFVTVPLVAPAGTAFVRLYFRINSNVAGQAMQLDIDNVQFQQGEAATNWQPSAIEVTDKNNALTAVVATNENASVTRDNALGTRVGVVEARMPAGNGALATSASVTSVETASVGRDNALGQRIDSVEVTAGGAQSTATQALTAANGAASAVTQVQAGQAGGGNMLANADFGSGSSGLILAISQWGALNSGVNYGGSERVPQGGTQFGFTAGNSPQGVVIFDHISEASATEGENWIASARLSTLDARAKIQLLALDANGAVIDYAESGWIEAFAGVAIGSWPLVSARFANGTPPGTTRVRWRWETDRLRGTDPYSWVTQPALAKGSLGQTQPGPWAVGATGLASATFALQVAQDAQITLTTNVNGHVSGMVSKNDGQRSSFEILADVFRVISYGMQGFEVLDGYQRNYSAGAQLILGHNFGAQNDLVLWYGPNIGAAACTKANAVIWFDKSGNAYFGGQVAQGVLRFFNSSQTVGVTSVATASNVSNNKLVAVTGQFMHDGSQGYSGQANFTPGGGATRAVVALERMYQGGSWVELARRTIGGSMNLVNGTDGDASVSWSISGSVLTTDVASAQLRAYRTRVIYVERQGFTASGSGAPIGQTNLSQYQSIESME